MMYDGFWSQQPDVKSGEYNSHNSANDFEYLMTIHVCAIYWYSSDVWDSWRKLTVWDKARTTVHYEKKLTSNRLFPGKQGYLAEFMGLGVHIWHACSTTDMFPKNTEKLRKSFLSGSHTKYLYNVMRKNIKIFDQIPNI